MHIVNYMFVYFCNLILQVGKLARHLGSNECEPIKNYICYAMST